MDRPYNLLRTAATPHSGSGGSAGLESGGFARAGRACTDVQRRDCYSGVMASIEAVKGENRRLYQENEQLRGRLKEARQQARALQRKVETGRYSATYVRHLLIAAVGIAVALTSLLHTIVIVGVM